MIVSPERIICTEPGGIVHYKFWNEDRFPGETQFMRDLIEGRAARLPPGFHEEDESTDTDESCDR